MGIDTLSTFVQWLADASWQAAVIVIIVLLIHTLAGRWLTPRGRLTLWSVVFIRLLMPVPPASEWSIFNLAARTPPPPSPASATSEPMTIIAAPTLSMPAPVALPPIEPSWSMWQYAAAIWLCGSIAVGLFMSFVALRLSRRLAALAAVDDARLHRLLDDARTTMHLRRAPRVVIDPHTAAPALFGLLRPTLVLPPGLLDRLDDQQLRHVLLHELAHLRRRDLIKNGLLLALSALHWFNPLIWLAFARYRADREMVCDAMVLSRLSPEESKPYGQTLIHVLEQIAKPRRLPMMVGIGESFAQLKRRIGAIARFGKLSRISTVIGVFALLLLVATTLTGAAEDEPADNAGDIRESQLVGEWIGGGGLAPVHHIFAADGTYKRRIASEAEATGTWSLHGNNLVRHIDGQKHSVEILQFEDDSFQIKTADGGMWAYHRVSVSQRGTIIGRRATDVGQTPAATSNDNNTSGSIRSRQQLERARDLYKQRKYHEALVAVDAVLADEPGNYTARMMRDMIAPHAQAQYELGEEIAAKLDMIIPVNFTNTALATVLEGVSQQIDVPFYVNWETFAQAGAHRNTPVTLQLAEPTAAAVLELVLNEVSFEQRLAYVVQDGAIKISTERELKCMVVETRIYDVRDLIFAPNGDVDRETLLFQIMDLVRQIGRPEEWQAAGGDVSSVTELNGNLIVNTYPQNHKEILALLVSLRSTRAMQIRYEFVWLLIDPSKTIGNIAMPDNDELLDDIEVQLILSQAEASDQIQIVRMPRLNAFNRQRQFVTAMRRFAYVTNEESQFETLDHGLTLHVDGTINNTRTHIDLNLQAILTNLTNTDAIPKVDGPNGGTALAEKPIVEQWLRTLSITVPDKATILLTSNELIHDFHPPNGEPIPGPRRVYVLIKPTIAVQTEEENLNFPGLRERPIPSR